MSLVVDFRLSNDKKNFFIVACERSDKSFSSFRDYQFLALFTLP